MQLLTPPSPFHPAAATAAATAAAARRPARALPYPGPVAFRQGTGRRWSHFAAPQRFHPLAGRLIPWFGSLAGLLAVAGLVVGLGIAPTDRQQGDAYRIIFVHVPAAWMSMVIYLAIGFWSAIGLAFNARLAHQLAQALLPTGASMTALALVTGALWGRPTWGAWWVWDARLTSELILLFLYIGVLSLHAAIPDPRRADRAAALLALVGVVNVPIIYFSVKWWNTLHQGASISFSKAPTLAAPMLLGLLLMALAFWAYCIAVSLARLRIALLERDADSAWAARVLAGEAMPATRGAAR